MDSSTILSRVLFRLPQFRMSFCFALMRTVTSSLGIDANGQKQSLGTAVSGINTCKYS
jgi:hypothetical protein